MTEKQRTKEVNQTHYHNETPEEVIAVLENARLNRNRIRVWYGKDGKSWAEENDIMGYVGRSTGTQKIPLLINNKRSYGGPGLLDHCIVKIVDLKNNRVLYQHDNFSQPLFTYIGNKVFQDSQDYAPQCKNEESARKLCEFMNGQRNHK